jgi:hypothetical protein
MPSSKRLLWIVLLLVAALAMTIPAGAQGEGQLRFVHAIPGAAAVDVYTDGQLTLQSLTFGTASSYIAVPAGAHQISVTQSGVTTPLWQQEVIVGENTAQTLVASSTEPLAFTAFTDDLNSIAPGNTRLTAIHAIAGGPAVDVLLSDGRLVIPNLQYNQPFGTFDVPAGVYEIGIAPAGGSLDEPLLPATPFALSSGTSNIVVVYGTIASPRALLLSEPTAGESAGGFVRVAHAIPGAPAVDVYINDALTIPSLVFGDAVGYLALPAGSYSVAVRAAGSTDDLLTGTLDIAEGAFATAIALGTVEAPELSVAIDEISTVNAEESVLSVVNALGDDATVSAELGDGSVVIEEVASGDTGSAIVAATAGSPAIGVTTGDETVSIPLDLPALYGGNVYTVIVTTDEDGEPTVAALPAVGLAQSVASAPGSQSVVVAQPTTDAAAQAAPTATPGSEVVAAQPTATIEPVSDLLLTATAIIDQITQTASAAQPAAPTATALPVQTEPTATPIDAAAQAVQPTVAASATPGPTARVVIDPGANLQLRQYPSAQSLSLGLVPSGALLRVLGRAGEPEFAPQETPNPTATLFADPIATAQAEGVDFIPADVWVYVIYDTPDGGTVSAWVNGAFISVTNPAGQFLSLATLPFVPSNRAGQALNTAIQPPSPPQNLVTLVVGNLDPGVNVHVRRVPDTAGESLALVGSNTVLEFIGLNEARDWAFVRYQLSPSSVVRGWVNMEFVSFQLNNNPIDMETLELRNLLASTPDDQRGDTGVPEGFVPPTATQDTLRDTVVAEVIGLASGANLHLRRTASVLGESLALIPGGTQLAVSAQNETGEWLQVTYQGQTGWISTAFARLTRNGQPFDLAEVPVVLTTPTPTPEATETPAA